MGSYDYTGAKELWEYDPVNNSWQKKTDSPGGMVVAASCFTIGAKAYIAGGGTNCWEYDVNANTWRELAFYGSRTFGTVFSIGSKGYFMTGADGDNQQHFQKDL